MNIVAQSDAVVSETQRKNGNTRERRYLGDRGCLTGPQATLIEIAEPGGQIAPHFHDVDQFQIFIDGGGRFGKSPLMPITIHYTDAYSPYGPIVAGDEGVTWFTLRGISSGGHFSMPQSRHLKIAKSGRNLIGVFRVPEDGPQPAEVVREKLIDKQHDGLEAAGIRICANAKAEAESTSGGPQYCIVCSGSIVAQSKEWPSRTLFYSAPGEPNPAFHAGPEGAAVLVLKFPRPTDRLGSDPAKLIRSQYVPPSVQ